MTDANAEASFRLLGLRKGPDCEFCKGTGVTRISHLGIPATRCPVCYDSVSVIDRLNAICQEYETGGFNDPGRAIDAVRDALGRR